MARFCSYLYLISLLLALFEPASIRYQFKVSLSDLVSIFSFFILFFVSLNSDLEKNSKQVLTFLSGLTLTLVLITSIQYIVFSIPLLYFFDIFKFFKFFYPFLVYQILNQAEKERIKLFTLYIFEVYVVLNLAFCFFQVFSPQNTIVEAFSELNHLQNSASRSFGFVGNPSQAGCVSLLMLTVLLPRKIALLPFICLFLHNNKISILLGILLVFSTLFAYLKSKFWKLKDSVAGLFIILSAVALSITYIANSSLLEFTLRALHNPLNTHTIYYRLNIIVDTLTALKHRGLEFVFLGYPIKNEWLAFDSQFVLLIFRYGVIGMIAIYLPIFFTPFRFRKSKYVGFAIFASSFTLVNSYHYRLAIICGAAILLTDLETSWSKPRKQKKASRTTSQFDLKSRKKK